MSGKNIIPKGLTLKDLIAAACDGSASREELGEHHFCDGMDCNDCAFNNPEETAVLRKWLLVQVLKEE